MVAGAPVSPSLLTATTLKVYLVLGKSPVAVNCLSESAVPLIFTTCISLSCLLVMGDAALP